MLLSLNSSLNANIAVAKRKKLTFTSTMKDEVSDEQLMLQYAKGDAVAFEILYERHRGGLYRYCLRQLGNAARAEECFQEVWMKLINSRVNYQPKALFTTYLYRIAHNHVIDIVRKDKKIKQETELDEAIDYASSDQGSADLVNELSKQALEDNLRQQIHALPLEQKTALLLKLDGGLSLEEIANVLNCGRETIKSRLRYAMAKLRACLENEHE
ncbi:sigma-70 family RNA polymerase sigma factor [Aliikangiella marina]|uniref:Sigma-70 family RNA polymerase sigma factor n=1 Tax=Aliikangiella marina TaxID=1712262 RepID=A0A545T962_9GAMM|nr:sigma-70 family RNA polymerase sigma factor [Aliikangiella marina]TQV73754.1 sigma-70 family RNA polymerase sigma factor [Aliikangiella marina]